MKVVGILLVRDEEKFVGQAVQNVLGFCDEFLAVDNGSTDGTIGILENLRAEFPAKIRLHRASHPRESHDLIAGLAGSDTWIFAVDGDEIYDPAGLETFRCRLEAGEFDRDWCVFGNVLNVRRLDLDSGVAEGHLAPPCRSMTKLYNFSAIEAWHGPCLERLHGGRVVFKDGFHEKIRRDLHQSLSWEDAEFRCLHLCFIPRSSKEDPARGPRKNIMDVHNKSLTKTLHAVWDRITGKPEIDWKEQRYGRGEKVVKPIAAFFPALENRAA
jgi:glycosyltransferase involved in cell wall biosynthesis